MKEKIIHKQTKLLEEHKQNWENIITTQKYKKVNIFNIWVQ
jgi:hypothetical protein